jgi:putative ABC transport system permease protein
MTFLGFIGHNVWARKVRSGLTAFAVAVGVTTVVTLGVVTHSLRTSAAAVLQTGKADFTVAQKGVDDVLNSVIDEKQLTRLAAYPGVASVVGVLLDTPKLDAQHPLFLEVGIPPDKLAEFGVKVVAGRPFGANAPHEIMLGWRAAEDLNKHVGDRFYLDGVAYTVTGIYSTGQVFGDAGSMLPLTTLQAHERKPGTVSLAFIRVKPGTPITPLRTRIEHDNPVLTTVRYATEFGRVDRTLQFVNAADKGATILALLIGTIIVTNTMLLSFIERIREFGVLRAVGWAREWIVLLVVGEALTISLAGAAIGVGLSIGLTTLLEQLPSLAGVLQPQYTSGVFFEALYTAAGIGLLGALYPGARAALLQPLAALRRE